MNLSQVRRYPFRDLNQEPPEYKSTVLPLYQPSRGVVNKELQRMWKEVVVDYGKQRKKEQS
jgi:hypothetical protein